LSLQTMKNFEYLAAGLPEIQMSLGIKSLEWLLFIFVVLEKVYLVFQLHTFQFKTVK
jgi:hypothetical protein